MSRCRFLRNDGTCGHNPGDEVREYCVEGPCSDYEELDLVHRQDVLALAKDIVVQYAKGGEYRHKCIDPQLVMELPSVKTTERLIAKIVFDEKKMREIVDEAIKPYRSIRGRRQADKDRGGTIGGSMTVIKLRQYWREEMKAAKKAMELYPVGSDEREIYRAKYNDALKHYNELFEEVYKK